MVSLIACSGEVLSRAASGEDSARVVISRMGRGRSFRRRSTDSKASAWPAKMTRMIENVVISDFWSMNVFHGEQIGSASNATIKNEILP